MRFVGICRSDDLKKLQIQQAAMQKQLSIAEAEHYVSTCAGLGKAATRVPVGWVGSVLAC